LISTFTRKCMFDYRSPRLGLALNNLKKRCQNFRKIFFSKKYFFI
jgi:hypothetical protein